MVKEKTMEDLKKKLGSNEALKTSSRHYLKIPLSKEHSGHPVGENSSVNQIINKRIIERIYELAKKNVFGVKEVKRCLDEFVEKELFSMLGNTRGQGKQIEDTIQGPAKSYFKSYCHREILQRRPRVPSSKDNRFETRFFLRTQEGEPSCFDDTVPTNESNHFRFVNEEEWQRKLLLKYGSDLALLDATYKTTKYAMLLFFLCVNTKLATR